MKSETLGSSTSVIEVTHVDTRGLWLYVDGREHYMPFDAFPWFADATVKQITHVERLGVDHMHWPELDVDLTLHMIDHPEQYPLNTGRRLRPMTWRRSHGDFGQRPLSIGCL